MSIPIYPAAGTAQETAAEADTPVWFDAVLRPNRRLRPRGFLILMLTLGGLSFAAGITIGAWPVFGFFFGLDVLAVYVAFRLNYRSGRRYEPLRLTESRLSLLRVDWCGQSERLDFQLYWPHVEIDDPRCAPR